MAITNVSIMPKIGINSVDYPSLVQNLQSLELTQSIYGSSRCELVLNNISSKGGKPSLTYLENNLLDFGKELSISFGNQTLFRGPISALTAEYLVGSAPQLRVWAEDFLFFKGRKKRSRSFENMQWAEIVATVINGCGLLAEVSGVFPRYEILCQTDETDLSFLYRTAALVGAEIFINGNTVQAKKRSSSLRTSATLTYGSSLSQFSVTADIVNQVSSVSVNGWSSRNKQYIEQQSNNNIPGIPGGVHKGADVLGTLGIENHVIVGQLTPNSEAEAQIFADTAFLKAAKKFVFGWGTSSQSEKIRPGISVTLKGLGTKFSGNYYVAESVFKYDKTQGAKTEFYAERSYVWPN